MLHLYASLLFERRILVSSSKLSTLTACLHGAAAMLYPMYWQHVYIPVLPQHLIDYCCAPMPYFIGVHSGLIEKVQEMALDDVVMFNVDTNTLETPFNDLQSLPNDVVSSLRSRLKKASMTRGDGVARAFLKAQVALFGSYRNALRIELEEPITFNQDAFITHRSSTMRQFLQNATQLQLFKEFIDGRLDLLNSGEGFSDVFEEEINMGEYAGSDKVYNQWLLTFKKGGGAFLNSVKTKANPAMKTVYKFAKDHAKIGIKEVKSRLKQKDLNENGYSCSKDDPGFTHLASTHNKILHTWEQRPIAVHFGESHIRPLAARKMNSNMETESHPELPLPYRPLRDTDFPEDEEEMGAEYFKDSTILPNPIINKFSELSLLDDSISSQQGGATHTKPKTETVFNSALSLDKLSSIIEPKEQQHGHFKYQRMELSSDEHTPEPLLGLKHSNYCKFWSQRVPGPEEDFDRDPSCLERPLSLPSLEPFSLGHESNLTSKYRTEVGSIPTYPQVNKTPKPGLRQEMSVGGQEFCQAINMSPSQSCQSSADTGPDLLHLLDPLSGAEESTRPALIPFQSSLFLSTFTQPPHYVNQKYYSPPLPGNPFSPTYVSSQNATYFHTPPLLVFGQASHIDGTQKSNAWSAGRASPATSSNSSLYDLLDSPAPPSIAQVLPPTHIVGKTNDPFSDLLTMAKASTVMPTHPNKKDNLQPRWETFD
ncbi:DENN domain-containing protein 1A isoform X2 [Trichomycterus rosablanca]